jgi:ssDNA-binding Zn-finger/Zn-ribbon topoisomerase 1
MAVKSCRICGAAKEKFRSDKGTSWVYRCPNCRGVVPWQVPRLSLSRNVRDRRNLGAGADEDTLFDDAARAMEDACANAD